MRISRSALLFASALVLSLSVTAQTKTKSTPEERAQWAVTLHKLETDPTSDATITEAAHAGNRLYDVDDVNISICGVFAEFPQKWNKATPVLIYLLALSAYQVETDKHDAYGENLYATRSVLKAYGNAVAKDPKLRDKKMDKLAALEASGKLDELMSKDGCKKD